MTTDLVPVYKPTPASAALRAALTGAGLDLHIDHDPGNDGRRYVAYPPGLAVVIADRGGQYIVGAPTLWQVAIWVVDADGDPDGDQPDAWRNFGLDATDQLAEWVTREVARLREDAQTSADTPEHVDVEEDSMPRRRPRRLRPGRHTHNSWPKTHTVKLTGPTKTGDGRRSYQVALDDRHIGWILREEVPRPPGRIRKHRTRRIWRANPSFDHLMDLTQRGRESKKGAAASLVAHWDAAQVPHA